jgi:hypothetical protein
MAGLSAHFRRNEQRAAAKRNANASAAAARPPIISNAARSTRLPCVYEVDGALESELCGEIDTAKVASCESADSVGLHVQRGAAMKGGAAAPRGLLSRVCFRRVFRGMP